MYFLNDKKYAQEVWNYNLISRKRKKNYLIYSNSNANERKTKWTYIKL